MTHDDAFVEAIITAPGDDTPRLIYADYLDERGDPRGEFIRVQIALARLPDDDPRRPELEARERWLLKEHEDDWVGPLLRLLGGGEMVAHVEFRRGFVWGLTIEASENRSRAEGDKGYSESKTRAAPSIRCGMASRRGQTTRCQMAKLSGKKSQVSRHRRCRRMPWSM